MNLRDKLKAIEKPKSPPKASESSSRTATTGGKCASYPNFPVRLTLICLPFA